MKIKDTLTSKGAQTAEMDTEKRIRRATQPIEFGGITNTTETRHNVDRPETLSIIAYCKLYQFMKNLTGHHESCQNSELINSSSYNLMVHAHQTNETGEY